MSAGTVAGACVSASTPPGTLTVTCAVVVADAQRAVGRRERAGARRGPGPIQVRAGRLCPGSPQPLSALNVPLRISSSSARVTATWRTRRSSSISAATRASSRQVVVERGLRRIVVERREPQADVVVVDEHGRDAPAALAPEVRDDHDRELEALGAVDRHQAHGLVGADLQRGVGRRRAGVQLGRRVVGEPAQVGPRARACRRRRGR